MNYKKIYNKIIKNRQTNPFIGYTERHHIIPRSLGGSDDKNNLVDLSAREHYICHLLLTKMYSKNTIEYHKMIHAYIMMCNVKSKAQSRTYKFNSKIYEYYKSEYSKIMSTNQTGSLNSQYGKVWIHNKILRECKKVDTDYILSDGWEYGRFINFDYLDRRCINCNVELNLFNNESKITLCNSCYSVNKALKTNVRVKKSDVKIGSKSFKYGKKCCCDGIIYNSVAEASYKLDIGQETLRNRIKSNNIIYNNYYYF